MLQENIAKANKCFISRVRSVLSEEENNGLRDEYIFKLVSEREYMAFLQGWLESQGYNTVGLDCTKETNAHKR